MLLDTAGLLCLHHRAEPFHNAAVQAYRSARLRITHDYVLAEFVAPAQARRLPRAAALAYVSDLLDNSEIETVWVDESLHREAVALLQGKNGQNVLPLRRRQLSPDAPEERDGCIDN